MARYTGPVCRLCRRFGEKLFLKGERCFTPKCAVERRHSPPGQQTGRRRRISERGLQLREKQKARFSYGVLERQFRRYFGMAERRRGITGQSLLQILEMRLDSVAHHLGFSDSRAQARQIIGHGHITVNQRRTNIPSYIVKPNDIIAWVPASRESELYQVMAEEAKNRTIPTWLSLDINAMTGRVLRMPNRDEIDLRVNEQAIVEYYAR